MSTGLRYRSQLATPGEPGARPRAFVPAARPPASHRVSPSLPRPPAAIWPPTRPDPAEDKQVRARRRSPAAVTAAAQARPRPRRPSSCPVAITDCQPGQCRRAWAAKGGVGALPPPA